MAFLRAAHADFQFHEEFLLSMGEWAAAELPKPDYSRQTDNRVGLTDAGNALAADLGLLVADTLTGKHPQLE